MGQLQGKGLPLLMLVVLSACAAAETAGVDWPCSAPNQDAAAGSVRVVDLNGNGRPDEIGDLHVSGEGESRIGRLWLEAPFDLDGEPDELRIYVDRNKDGRIDLSEGWLWRCLDLDDDGVCDDRDSDLHELDLTGKGFPHERIRYQDTDGDGDADLRVDYPTYSWLGVEQRYRYITGNRCMRQTWRGLIHGFDYWLYLDDDDDNLFPPHEAAKGSAGLPCLWTTLDADGSGTLVQRFRHPQEPLGMGVEGRRSSGETQRWYDLDGDGFTDMHLRDYEAGIMRWSFDWDGDAAHNHRLDDAVPAMEAHVDYDVAFHTLGEEPRNWWAGDQVRFWDFCTAFDLPRYYRKPGAAFDFARDFVPANSAVHYTLKAPWRMISLTWLEDTEDAGRSKDVSCHRIEGIWGYYHDFDSKSAFVGSRREFDRDGNSAFRLYLSPIDGRYHLYDAEDGIFYRDPDCRRNHYMVRPTAENIRKYVREIITYSDRDGDGFFDTFSHDRDLDGKPDEVISRPDADRAELTDMNKAWRCGPALDSLYRPGAEDRLPVDFQVKVDWEKTGYQVMAKVHVCSSRPLVGYRLRLRAEEHVDYNILSRRRLRDGEKNWEFVETIPRAQFILPGPTRVTAILVNNVGRIVGRRPAGQVEVEPLNSPVMNVGYYRAWSGKRTRDSETFTRMGPKGRVAIGESIRLEVGVEFMTSREMTLVFEPFLTDESERPRWPLGKKIYRVGTGELVAAATMRLVPFGEQVLEAVGGQVDPSLPLSLEDYLGIREKGDRVYIPPGRTYRLGFRLYIDGRPVEDRILYYDWLESVPQTITVRNDHCRARRTSEDADIPWPV